MEGLSRDAIMNLGVYCALAGIVGAKLFMLALDPYYHKNPSQIFTISTLQSAGIWYGGFIFALIFAFFYMRQERLPFFKTCDVFAPGLAIGHCYRPARLLCRGLLLRQADQLALGSYLYQSRCQRSSDEYSGPSYAALRSRVGVADLPVSSIIARKNHTEKAPSSRSISSFRASPDSWLSSSGPMMKPTPWAVHYSGTVDFHSSLCHGRDLADDETAYRARARGTGAAVTAGRDGTRRAMTNA